MRERTAVAQTIAQVAHDLRSPLGAIDIATRKITGGEGPLFEMTNAAVRRSNSILDEALRAWKSTKPAYAEVNQNDLTEASLQVALTTAICESSSRYHNLKVQTKISAAAVTVFISESELCRIFINILNNSAQTRDEEVSVEIFVSRIEGAVSVTFQDNGPGFSLEALKKATSGEFSEKSAGTGIGLNFCRSAVERASGVISIYNLPSQGACVTVSLPTRQPLTAATGQ